MPLDPHAEMIRLRTAVRDLVALSSISTVWVGKECPAIAEGLAEVLVASLGLDFAFVQLCDPEEGAAVEVRRGNAWKTFNEWREYHLPVQFSCKEIVPDLGEDGQPCRGVVIPIGVNAELGLVAAACSRTDFPNEIDQLLLSVAANQAAAAFQNARLRSQLDAKVAELRVAGNELEIKVAERTAKLTTANEELHRQKEQLDRLFELSPVAVILTDLNFQILRVSQEFTHMFGYPPGEAVGRLFHELIIPEEFQEEARQNMALVRSGQTLNLESVRRRKDGVCLDVSITVAPVSLGPGQSAVYLIYRDITEHKRAQEDLRRSEAYLAEAQRASHTGSFGWNVSSDLIYWSQEAFRVLEYDEAIEPTLELVLQRTHPEDRSFVRETLDHAVRDRKAFDFEHRLLMPDGSVKYVRVVGHPSTNDQSGNFEFVGAVTDITKDKRAEESLRRSEGYLAEAERLAHIGSWAAQVPSGAVRVPQLKMVYWSEEMYRIFCLDPGPTPPSHMERARRVHPEDVLHHRAIVEQAILDRTDFETDYRLLLPNGTIKYIHAVGHPVLNASGDVIELVGTAMDVTEQHEARAALQAAFEQIKAEDIELRQMTDAVASFIYVLRPDGTAVYANQTALDYTGLTLDDVQREDHRARVFHPEDVERLCEERSEALARGVPFENEQRALGKDGKYRWFLVRYNPLRDDQGRITRWYATGTDIEDRKQAEEALRKSEERWRSVFENSAIGVSLTDPDGGRFLATNHVYQTMLGYTDEELRALSFLDVTPEEYHEANWALVTELLEGKRQQYQMEKQYVRKDGSLIWVSVNVSLVPGTDRVPRFFMALSEDITERKRAEEALRRSEAYLADGQRLAKTGSWAYNPNTERAIYWSEEMRRIFGLDPQTGNLPDREEFLRLVHPEDRDRFNERIDKARREKTAFVQDYRVVLPDGTVKHIHGIGHPVLDETGNILEYVGTDVDVTERKRAEKKLQRSEADLLEAQRISQTGNWKHDVSSGTVTVSPEVFRIFGIKPDEGTSTLEFWLSRNHPEDQKRIKELFERSEIEKTDYEADYRIVLPDGAIKHLHAIGHPVLNELGELVEFIGTVMDITERKQTEEALRRSESYLAEAQRLTHAASWAWRVAGRDFLHLSEEWFRIYGFDPKKGIPAWNEVLQRIHPEDRARWEGSIDRAVDGKSDYEMEYRILLPSGTLKHIRTVGHPILSASGDLVEFVGSATDITERKQSEEALRRSEAYLTEAQRLTHTGSWAWNVRTDALFWSQEIFRIYNYDPAMTPTWEFLLERVHPEDRPEIERRKKMESTQKEWTDSEADFRIVLPDGTIKHLHSIAHPVMDKSNQITEIVGTVMDVTERKRADEERERLLASERAALAESVTAQQRFLNLVNSVEGIVWEADVPSFQFLFISKQAERVLGYPVGRWVSEPSFWKDHLHPEDQKWVVQFCQNATTEKRDHQFEYRMVAADGTVRWLRDLVTVVVEGDRVTRLRGLMVDLTQHKQAEEALLQAQSDLAHVSRVTTMGELTASLAHEVRQPIAAALTDAETCLHWLGGDSPNIEKARAAAMRIVKDGTCAAEIVSRIRLLFNKGTPQHELVDVNQIIAEMTVLLRGETTRYAISVRTELAANLSQVIGDRVQLQQVLLNLMINSIDAMKGMAGTRELAIKSQRAENEDVVVSVTDNGVGLPPQQGDQIFNAFFTTKPHGTGMGLRISRTIIESHGGRLWATANSGRGATFHFTLPSATAGQVS